MNKNLIMLRVSATIATISMAGTKNLGTALMKNCMQLGCAKIAISITTTKRKGKGNV